MTSGTNQLSKWMWLWPGLPRLWLQGDLSSLAIAIGFAVLLNLALLSTFVWTQWLGTTFTTAVWPVIGIVWVASWFLSRGTVDEILSENRNLTSRNYQSPTNKNSDALFVAAQTEYLKGNWSGAESRLRKQLRFNTRDAESRLLLVSVLRCQQRHDDALNELDHLQKFDQAEPWQAEIQQLYDRLEREMESAPAADLDADLSATSTEFDPTATATPPIPTNSNEDQRAA